MKTSELKTYCCWANHLSDVAVSGSPVLERTITTLEAIASEVYTTMDWLTIQAFQICMSRSKNHFSDLKDENVLVKWNPGFAAIAHMHYTDKVLGETFVPISKINIDVFDEMQAFMYDILNDHLNTNKGKLLVSLFRSTLDAQGIYCELKKHALTLIKAQLLGDTLLEDIRKTRLPEN
jgi:hypothetical protein